MRPVRGILLSTAALIAFTLCLALPTAPLPAAREKARVPERAAPASKGERSREGETKPAPLTVGDVISIETAGEVDISPDGMWAVWVKTKADEKENARRRSVYLTNLADTATIRITKGPGSSYAPHFSPDGSKIAFIGERGKEKPQIYIYDKRGGEPEKLTSASGGVRDHAWRGDTLIVFTAREDSTLLESKRGKAKDDAVVVADQEHYPPVRLFSIHRRTKRVRRISVNDGAVTEFAVSPDGRRIVTNENQDVNYTYDNRVPPKQFLYDLEAGTRREIFTEPYVDPFEFKWDNGGSGFYCIRRAASDSTQTYVSINRLYYYDLGTERLVPVARARERGLGHGYVTVGDGVVAALADGVRDRIVHVKRSGGSFTATPLATPSGRSVLLRAGTAGGLELVYLVSDASSIPELVTATVKGKRLAGERTIAPLNGDLRKKTLTRTDIIRWSGALGEEVEGVLYYPIGYREGERYPLVINLHGGPAGVDRDFFDESWADYPHLLASKGTFVLKVNYHGSANYGLAWVESIKGHYYEYEVPDVLRGVEHLITAGIVDTGRVGIMGWSNGSILAIACCLGSDRFRALCAGAGDVNWISDYGNCAFGAGFDNAYFGGPPWKSIETYIEKSPFFRLQEMETPTLIMFGTEDTSVPTEQGWQHFRAMQQIGKAPVRFLLFPGAPHGLSKPSQQKRKMEEELAWFDRYLFGTHREKNESFEEESPLAMALKLTGAAMSDGLFGERVNGIIVPEVVEEAGMAIGRFEVTRAQYAAYDPDFRYPTGTGNHPANGITYEQAEAYCSWLSAKTGCAYRLPAEAEMQKLITLAKPNIALENNLDRWAGYSPTPDEVEMIREKIEELEKSRLLIERVGFFKPAGEKGVYDIGGNVAEWVTTDASDRRGAGETRDSRTGGTGRVMGLSAVSPRDERFPYAPPPERYIGFRVCRD